MASFDEIIDKAVEDRVIPGVVLLAKDKSGKLDYARAIGRRSLKPGEEDPMELSSVFTLMSMTKLVTAVAVLQVVERGLIKLDDDVAPIMPVLAEQQVLHGFDDDGKPILKPRKNTITLRHLLTHSFGQAYPFLDPTVARYFEHAGRPLFGGGNTVEEAFNYPLLYEPGEGFAYSPGLDWAGRIVEQLTGTKLEDWMREHILQPLGVSALTFFPERHPELQRRMVPLALRDAESGKMVANPAPAASVAVKEAFGGQGLYADARDYFAVMESLLKDDGRLLRAETAALLFEPHLSAASRKACNEAFEKPDWASGYYQATGEFDWSPGGILTDGDSHEHRRRGFLQWSGMYNLAWFIDRKAGVAGVFATQFMPFGDPKAKELMKLFEEEMYKRAS